ncbi:MAG: hypothetical protein ABL993_15735 [Vicinamibacterales bacterium]
MSWRHRISLVVLMVLTALPVSGTLCAMLCDSAKVGRAAAHHHGSGKACDEEATPAPGPQLRGGSSHDCSDHEAVREAAITTATRADSVPGPSLLAAVAVHDTISNLVDSDDIFDYRTPPGSTPPTASSLVLRV